MWYSFKGAHPIYDTKSDLATMITKGYIQVEEKPVLDNTDKIIEWDYENLVWNVRDGNDSDYVMDWYIVREKRAILLKDSDIVLLKFYETGQAVPQEWVEYRQALRDIPQSNTNPKNIKWPIKP